MRTAFVLRNLALVMLSASPALLGCGGDSTSPVDQFVGTWHYDQTTGSVVCGSTTTDLPPAGNKEFSHAIKGGLVDLSISPVDNLVPCNFDFDVSGVEAKMHANQSCTLTGGDLLKPTDWRFTLLAADQAEEIGGATIEVNFTDVTTGKLSTAICSYSLNARLTKVAKD